MQWYYVNEKDRVGPFDDDKFNELITSGTITAQTMVWNDTMTDWQRLDSIDKIISEKNNSVENNEITTAIQASTLCSQCGSSFPEDELATFDGAKICAECKPSFVQKIREGINVGDLVFAGFWIRLAAKLIDGLVLLVANTAIGFICGTFSTANMDPMQVMTVTLFASGLQMCAAAAYNCWFLGKFGATPGKMACGIKVVTGENEKVSYLLGFGRYFGEMLSSIIFCIGYLMIAFDSEKRGLHDRVCNTRVIYNNRN